MNNKLSIIIALAFGLTACKQSFLDIKQNKSQVVPTKISDFQSMLDYNSVMNYSSHVLGILGADEYYVNDGMLSTAKTAFERNGYIWAAEVYEGGAVEDWNNAYKRILISNLALEGINQAKYTEQEKQSWNNVKGSALFYRAQNFYQLAQLFCKPYDALTSNLDPGIPLRLESDINIKSTRSTVQQTYEQVIADLKIAATLLPVVSPTKKAPSKAAALALLAKAFLLMSDYSNAGYYADQCLQINDSLIDLNELSSIDERFPYTSINIKDNPEVILLSGTSNIGLISTTKFNADKELLLSYDGNDLRRRAYFFDYNERVLYGGGYNGGYNTGLATNEGLLIRAECYARQGKVKEGLDDLHQLQRNRYDRTSYQPINITDKSILLRVIIDERRKELVLRGVRWEDLRRLNKEAEFAKTLVRKIDGKQYELSPNDQRYVWPLPEEEIQLNGLAQNLR